MPFRVMAHPTRGVHHHGFLDVPHFHILAHLIIEAQSDPGIAVHETGKGRDIHRPFDLPETIHVVPDLELEGDMVHKIRVLQRQKNAERDES